MVTSLKSLLQKAPETDITTRLNLLCVLEDRCRVFQRCSQLRNGILWSLCEKNSILDMGVYFYPRQQEREAISIPAKTNSLPNRNALRSGDVRWRFTQMPNLTANIILRGKTKNHCPEPQWPIPPSESQPEANHKLKELTNI